MGSGLVLLDAIFDTASEGRSYILLVWFDSSDLSRTPRKIDLDKLVTGIYNRKV